MNAAIQAQSPAHITFTAATFNLRSDTFTDFHNRWNRRREIAAELIQNSGAVIIGVQELLPGMRTDIEAMLSGYTVVGQGRSRRLFNEHSDIIVKLNEAQLELSDTFWLSKSPKKVGSRSGFALFPRICTSVQLKLDETHHIRVYNTHLDCLSPAARALEILYILKRINDDNERKPLPYILMGDFNAGPESRIVSSLCQNTHQFDKLRLREANVKTRTYHGFKGKTGGKPIDYIFVSEHFEILDTHVEMLNHEGKYPSDHYPVVATLSL